MNLPRSARCTPGAMGKNLTVLSHTAPPRKHSHYYSLYAIHGHSGFSSQTRLPNPIANCRRLKPAPCPQFAFVRAFSAAETLL